IPPNWYDPSVQSNWTPYRIEQREPKPVSPTLASPRRAPPSFAMWRVPAPQAPTQTPAASPPRVAFGPIGVAGSSAAPRTMFTPAPFARPVRPAVYLPRNTIAASDARSVRLRGLKEAIARRAIINKLALARAGAATSAPAKAVTS